MFSVDCPGHGGPVLLSSRAITDLRNLSTGIELDWRCHCGATGTLRVAGRHAPSCDDHLQLPAAPAAA